MKSKTWGIILAAVLVLCLGLGIWFITGNANAASAEIWSEGVLVKRVSLAVNQSFSVESKNGMNVITVQDGKIAVTQADCPDGYCMKRGFCNGGMQIVCLPNQLVIRFVSQDELDGVSG